LYEDKWDLDFDMILELLYAKRSANVQLTRPGHENASQGSGLSCIESVLEPDSVLLDLRSNSDFSAGHLPGAVNLPLLSLRRDIPGPFDDPNILEAQWNELNDKLCSNGAQMSFTKPYKRVAILCYQGDTARVASSILRAKKIEAYSVKGGTLGLHLFDGSEIVSS
jgi:rhodanese-related sulfurtransferase